MYAYRYPSWATVTAIAVLVLSACSTPAMPTTTLTPQPTPTPAPLPTEELPPLPLSPPGPYSVGIRRIIKYQDPSRDSRQVWITIWYPAGKHPGSSVAISTPDAVADPSGAPYPLVLSSSKSGFDFAPHLVSYGFVVVGIIGIDTYIPWDHNLLDQPLDILFALDRVAEEPIAGLEGIIDTEHVGTMGYSFDGYNALAVSGARVDPEFYLSECARTPLRDHWITLGYCNVADAWSEFAAYAGEAITVSSGGLWHPMTDDRIRAVMPMGADGYALFGERGLAAANRAMLLIAGTEDHLVEYTEEAVNIFEHVGSRDKTLVSFVGQDHYMVLDPVMVSRMGHFAVAFFGHQLQGREDLAYYYSEDFVSMQQGLAWGPYTGR